MNDWWNARSPREKSLLGVAGFILAGALLWQLVLNPAILTLERARLEHERASQMISRLDRIEMLIQQGEQIQPHATAPVTQDAGALLAEAERLAGEAALIVATSEPAGDTTFRIKLSAATGPDYFKWIEQVETGLGVAVSAAVLTQNADGSLDADTQFSLDGIS